MKPRVDQRKGGNGFGVNEDGAGYTLTAVDRHGVSQSLIGGTAPGHKNVVVSTNSNGDDVAATLTRDLAKQTGAQQQNGGGVRPHPPRGFCLDRFGQYGDREVASAMKMRDYKDHTDLVVHEKEGAEGE